MLKTSALLGNKSLRDLIFANVGPFTDKSYKQKGTS